MAKDDDIILSARGIEKSYSLGKRRQQVLSGVDLRIKRGEFIAIMGASGSGKSTLLHILGLLDQPDKGHVYFEGSDVHAQNQRTQDRMRNRDIGFVFQFYHLLAELSVEENVLLPLMVGSPLWRWPRRRRAAKRRAREVIEAVNLQAQAQQRPATLSGGERQRTALARALVAQPKLLLADEPTGNLDSTSGKAILDVLAGLNQAGQTIVMVTHDRAVAALAQRRLLLRDGVLSQPPGKSG